MDITTGLFIVGFIIVFGLIAQYIFSRFRVPDVLILIGLGALITHLGFSMPFRDGSPELTFAITFSLIYVVFYGALPIKLNALFSTLKYAFGSSILNLVAITGVVGVAAKLAGFGWVMALALGALFCVLDGSIINSLLEKIRLGKRAEAQIQTESAIIDILVIVGVLSIINFASMGFDLVMQSLASYIFLSLGVGVVAGLVWALTLEKIGHYGSAPVATMAVLVMIYAFAEYVNANGVITVFSFSVILGNVTLWSKILYKEQKEHARVVGIGTKNFFKDVSFLVRTFLFVYLGMLVDFSEWGYLLVGLGFFLLAYAIRSLIGRVFVNKSLRKKEVYYLDAMSAKGMTPTVILAVISGSNGFANIVVGGIFFSVMITSILILLIQKDKFTSFSEIVIKHFHPVKWVKSLR